MTRVQEVRPWCSLWEPIIPDPAPGGKRSFDYVPQEMIAGSRTVGVAVRQPGGIHNAGPDLPALFFESGELHFGLQRPYRPGATDFRLRVRVFAADMLFGVSMIRLTRLNRVPMVLNSDLIEHIDVTPDTVITLTTGQILRVRETAEEVIRRIIEFRRQVFGPDSPPAVPVLEDEPGETAEPRE